MSCRWAPLVHARTYEADFRILIAPEDFTDEDLAWARERIRVTTRCAERLSDGPRWSVFRHSRHTLVGVTCRASEVSDEMNRDAHGRPLYVFLGWVTTDARPGPCGFRLDGFAGLYAHVRARWMDRESGGAPERAPYEDRVLPSCDAPAASSETVLRTDVTEVYRDEPSVRLRIWHEAFASARPVSVCLGSSRLSDVDPAVLDAATVRELAERRVSLAKPTGAAPTPPEPVPRGVYERFWGVIRGVVRLVSAAFGGGNVPDAEPVADASQDGGRDQGFAVLARHDRGTLLESPMEDGAPEPESPCFQLQIVAYSHAGAVRAVNEDAVLVGDLILEPSRAEQVHEQRSTAGSVAIVVADGMGGHRGGAVASRRVVEALLESFRGECLDTGQVTAILREVNAQLFSAMETAPDLMGMGSTVAGVLCRGQKALVFNVGDSRVYRVQDNLLEQLTEDDTRQPVSYGEPPGTREERSTAITQALGGATRFLQISPHVREIRLRVGTVLVVCSDGLFDGVPQETLESAIGDDLDESTRRLTQAAMDAGGRDNISVVLVRVC